MSGAEPLHFVPPQSPEDRARADLYALIARLFYAPPDASLLQSLAEADEIVGEDESVPLAEAWSRLQAACAIADEDAVQDEYDGLLVGVGRAPVSPYLGAHLENGSADATLVELRAFLAARGLGRQVSISEPEDHIAALCEVMRHLIAVQQAGIAVQRDFFHQFIKPGGLPLCDALAKAGEANYYRAVAGFAKSFFELESTAFEMQ